jgi:hypothetical protein
LPFAGVDVSERAKAIDLQFKDKLVGVERLKTAGKPIGRILRGTCTEV